MKFLFSLFLSLALLGVSAQELALIPLPNKINLSDGQLNAENILVSVSGTIPIPDRLLQFCKGTFTYNPEKAAVALILSIDNSPSIPKEGYTLNINSNGIQLSAVDEAGLFYGLQTLYQLVNTADKNKMIPFLTIEDSPSYSYRGLHLDVVRHIFPVEFIKQYIDIMAAYKFNTFHWHLTDDQGWRIEIKKYPKLTEIGAYRDQTLIGNMQQSKREFDGVRYGGYYTQDEIREIVKYAAERYITIIPEIEMPGHAEAAIVAYPELACTNNEGPFGVVQYFGVFENVFCAGKDNTFKFLQDVLDEVIALFPSEYIHIGGDECPKTKWKTCPDCQKRIKKQRLKDEHELQSYFVQRMEKYLNSKGKKIIGWDEILEGGLAPNATVMSWRGTEGGIAAAKQNHDVIMVPTSHLYLDYRQSKSPEEPLAIGGYLPLSKVYSFYPTPTDLSLTEQKHILGVQANLWTEYIPTPGKALYMLLPRALAVSEIGWTNSKDRNWTSFSENRLPFHLAEFDRENITYRVPEPIGAIDTTLTGETFTLNFKPSVQGAKVYYTIDGYTPQSFSSEMNSPLVISVPKGSVREVKSVVITPSGRRSVVVTTTLKNNP